MIVYMYLIRESFHGLLHLNMKLILKYINIMISSLTNVTYILLQDKKRSRDSSVGGQPSKKRR